MLSERVSAVASYAQEHSGYYSWFSSLPVVALCSRVNALLENCQLSTNLQHLEVTDYDDRAQYVAVLMKVKGRLDGELLKRQFKQLVQNYNRDRQMGVVDEQWMPELLEAPPLSLVNLTEFSAAEHHAEIFRYILKHAQGCQALTSRTQMHAYALRLHLDTHLLLLNLWQSVPSTLSSATVMQDLCKIFAARGKDGATVSAAGNAVQGEEKSALLTSRELEMVRYIAEGCSNREIARRCCIAEGTVKRHLNNIYIKLDANSRTQAIARVQSLNLLVPIESEE